MTETDNIFRTPHQMQTYDSLFYLKRIQEFTNNFSVASLWPHQKDPMSAYLTEIMENENVRKLVATCREGKRIFTDTTMDFVSQYLHKGQYHRLRRSAEEHQINEAKDWSDAKIAENWKSTVIELEKEYAGQGFAGGFYISEFSKEEDGMDALWLNLLQEWQRHFNLRLEILKKEYIRERGNGQLQLLLNNLMGASEYIIQKSITEKEFGQTWALMGGHWNTLVFERLFRTTLLQQHYPILEKIAEKMGRKAEQNGTLRTATVSGRSEKMGHMGKSDIAGISMGHDLGALLPLEMALFMDGKTEDVFLQKYVSNRLQIFDYQSKVLKAARNLATQAARPKGPIVVCVDTSGSMTGKPSQIALSLMMRLTEISEAESRPCFLIAFSVAAKAIDVLLDRTHLLKFFAQQATGNTDAQNMMDVLFDLLHNNPHYGCADVLWMTDFRIPFPPARYLQKMEGLRKAETHFYGLQIGKAENRWHHYFDEIFQIADF